MKVNVFLLVLCLTLKNVACDEAVEAVPAPVETSSETTAETTAESSSSEATEEPAPEAESSEEVKEEETEETPVQSGPLIDLLGPNLLSLEMVGENQAKLAQHLTSDALAGKKVIGLYFSADWCGPCRQFTPELVSFYNKMNTRRGKKDQFEIVWVSRCRDVNSFGQYFTQMPWLALPPEEAMGQRGQTLGDMYKVKGIPSLVLLDDLGNVITTDARNKIPQDKAGIGFPWRNPLSTLYMTVVPRSLRLMIKAQIGQVKDATLSKVKGLVPGKRAA